MGANSLPSRLDDNRATGFDDDGEGPFKGDIDWQTVAREERGVSCLAIEDDRMLAQTCIRFSVSVPWD